MVEYVGISYVEVIKHAILPALIGYIALVYIVHLEALKLGLKGLDKPTPTLAVSLRLLRVLLPSDRPDAVLAILTKALKQLGDDVVGT